MNGRVRGLLAISIGFVTVAIAGFSLSIGMPDQRQPNSIIFAFIIFIAVTPLFIYGIYQYARYVQMNTLSTPAEMENPRRLLEILRAESPMSIADLATRLNVPIATIKGAIAELNQLDVFNGIVNWQADVIAMVSAQQLQHIQQCQYCKSPLSVTGGLTICEQCHTHYYQSGTGASTP